MGHKFKPMNITIEGKIIEDYLHNNIQIRELSKKYNTHEANVLHIISKYFGTGKYKIRSAYKGRSWKACKRLYTNITNLEEIYEQERKRSR